MEETKSFTMYLQELDIGKKPSLILAETQQAALYVFPYRSIEIQEPQRPHTRHKSENDDRNNEDAEEPQDTSPEKEDTYLGYELELNTQRKFAFALTPQTENERDFLYTRTRRKCRKDLQEDLEPLRMEPLANREKKLTIEREEATHRVLHAGTHDKPCQTGRDVTQPMPRTRPPLHTPSGNVS